MGEFVREVGLLPANYHFGKGIRVDSKVFKTLRNNLTITINYDKIFLIDSVGLTYNFIDS